jgi:hypothetical protein
MRGFASCALAGTFVALTAMYVGAQAPAVPARDAGPILGAARQALGGDKKLTAVKTFTAAGRTKQIRGENLVPIEFEIFVELPDKYVRKDEVPAQETGVTAAGFNGDDLVQDPPPPPPPTPPAGAPSGPPRSPSAARVTTLKQDFARLTLGMFATSFSAYPLTFTYVGEAEAPQGKADVVDAKGPNNFTLRLFIAKETHLPIMVSWQAPAPPAGRGRPGGPGAPAAPGSQGAAGVAAAPGAAPASGAAPAQGAAAPGAQRGAPPAGAPQRGAPTAGAPQAGPENRIYFADYRDVDGMQFPFRLRRAVGPETIEETTFDRYKVNAKIDPKRFEVRK